MALAMIYVPKEPQSQVEIFWPNPSPGICMDPKGALDFIYRL
jgi:hypothetical protein